MPEELDKPGVDNNQLEDCDRVSEFERIIYRQGSITSREDLLKAFLLLHICKWNPIKV